MVTIRPITKCHSPAVSFALPLYRFHISHRSVILPRVPHLHSSWERKTRDSVLGKCTVILCSSSQESPWLFTLIIQKTGATLSILKSLTVFCGCKKEPQNQTETEWKHFVKDVFSLADILHLFWFVFLL